MSLAEFRKKVQEYRRMSGHAQKELAEALGLNPHVLSHKLNGTDNSTLTNQEVKQIIKTLAGWEAITTRREAIELLAWMNLKAITFSQQEWDVPPLHKLERDRYAAKTSTATTAAAIAKTSNLPVPLTPLVGREKELAAIVERMSEAGVRLVTITGPGGMGKTRLSLAAAEQLAEKFADGAYLVPLATITDPVLFIAAIARAFSLKESGETPLIQTLQNYLSNKELLLVLDNFEQLIEAAPLVNELLAAAPGLKILATSREILHIYGETEINIAGLKLPDTANLPKLEKLVEYEAVRLFGERARAAQMSFQVTGGNAAAVAEICARLEGLPLALELAAARIRNFSPEAISEKLRAQGERFNLLVGGPRDTPSRHQTLRNTLDWSFELLEQNEQQQFVRLGVFRGGFSAEAAETIAAANLNEVYALLAKSLVQLVASLDNRFNLLETIREYALERLADNPPLESETRLAHARFFLTLAETAEPQLRGAEQVEWIARLEMEHDNLRGAMEWCLQSGNALLALHIAATMAQFWYLRGHMSEGLRWLQAALAKDTEAPKLLRAKALNASGALAQYSGNYALAEQYLEESLVIKRELGDMSSVASSLNNLGATAVHRGDFARARVIHQEALEIRRSINDTFGVSVSLNNLAEVLRAFEDYEGVVQLQQESLQLKRELGDKRGIAVSLANLADTMVQQKDYARATELYQEGLRLFREVGDRWNTSVALSGLGELAYLQQDYKQAAALYEESLSLKRELDDKLSIAADITALAKVLTRQNLYKRAHTLFRESLTLSLELEDKAEIARCLEGWAETYSRQKNWQQSAQLLGKTAQLNEEAGKQPSLEFEAQLELVKTNLEPENFNEAWQQGQKLNVSSLII